MSTSLTAEQMKAFVARHFDDFVNHRMAEVIRSNMTADFIDHDGPGGKTVGVEEDEAMMRQMYDQMPGITVTIESIVAEVDMVVCRNVWRWTTSDGAAMEFSGFVQWRFEGDKIAERWARVSAPSPAN